MQKNVIETLTGAGVLVVAGLFLAHALKHSDLSMGGDGYKVLANFSNVSGIAIGSDVRIGGVKVGVVSDMKLDPQTYEAVTAMELREDVHIPADSSATIASSGLLGEKFVEITPGGEEKMLEDGGKLAFTQSSVNLEQMIGKFMFSGGGVDKEEGKPNAGANDAQ